MPNSSPTNVPPTPPNPPPPPPPLPRATSAQRSISRIPPPPPPPPTQGNTVSASSPASPSPSRFQSHSYSSVPGPITDSPATQVTISSSTQLTPPPSPPTLSASAIPTITPSCRAHLSEGQDHLPWNLREGFVIPSLTQSLNLSAHLAASTEDDPIIRFRFATHSEVEITLHRSRLLFVNGPLAALVRRQLSQLNHGFITLCPKDRPQVFRHIRHFLYGLPLDLTKLNLPHVIDLALSADRWKLDDLFVPIAHHLCRNPLVDAASLVPAAKLFNLEKTSNKLRSHIRAQVANYLSNSLQASFPNAPLADTCAILQTFHEVNDLGPALSLASRQAPFLPLLHGVIGALETRLDDFKLSAYVHALPVAAAGISRLLACDAATARWPARAVRIAATVAIGAANDVARAAVPLHVGATSSVTLAGVTLGLSSNRDANGVAVCVNLRRESERRESGVGVMDDWRFSRIGVRGGECPCACGSRLKGGGDVVVDRSGTLGSRTGVVRFDGAAVDQWKEEHSKCGQMWLSVEVELLRGRAAIFVCDKDKRTVPLIATGSKKKARRKPSSDSCSGSDKVEEAPALYSTVEGRRSPGSTIPQNSSTPGYATKDERSSNEAILWVEDM